MQYSNVGGATTPTTPTLTAAFKSFDDVQNGADAIQLVRMEHQHQAGFVPPKVMVNMAQQQHISMQTNMNTSNINDQMMTGSDEDESTMFSDDSLSQQNEWGSNAMESGSTSQNSNDSGLNGFSDFNNNSKKARKPKRSSNGRKRGEKVLANAHPTGYLNSNHIFY